MFVAGRLYFYVILILSLSLFLNVKGDILNTKERRKRHVFPFLGYLHSYQIGQHLALELPTFVLPPVIIIPINQPENVNIQETGIDKGFQENNDTLQIFLPIKLTLNTLLEDIDTDFKFSPVNCTLHGDVTDVNETFRQINIETGSSTENIHGKDNTTSPTDNFENGEIENFNIMKPNTSVIESQGFYAVPAYDGEKINSLQITTPFAEMRLDSTSKADEGKNVTSKTNNIDIQTNKTENIESGSSTNVSFQIITENYYPGPNTRYYNPHSFLRNAMVHQSPIRTNSYREEEKELPLPPWYDDRWRRFSSLRKVVLPASGFKPLAGLYYDGFLHKSLTKKSGFIPFDKYYD